jgi:hypothetical protein
LQLDFESGLSREYSVSPLDAALIGCFAGLGDNTIFLDGSIM